MEMAAGGSGDDPVSERSGSIERTDLMLYLVALLLACACVVGGVMVFREHEKRGDESVSEGLRPPSASERERYGEVTEAARTMALALLNIDYEKPEESLEAVQAAATGSFLDEYSNVTDSLRDLVTQFKAQMTSEVVATAVSSVDEKEAKVLVATEGTVVNSETGADDPQARNFRLLITVGLENGTWLASDLVFVG